MISADVDPPEAYAATHPDFRALIVNAPLSAERAKFASVAKQAKVTYTFLGVFSLAAAGVTLTSIIYASTLDPSLADDPNARFVFGAVGALGIVAQVALLRGPFKKDWLGARFIAERLRCIKFQAFAEAACVGPDYAAGVDAFTKRTLGDLALHAKDSVGAMYDFDPDDALGEAPRPREPFDAARLQELKDIYRKLRLDYQTNHATAQIQHLKEERRLPASASEISFWGGVALGYVDAILAVARPGGEGQPLLHFFTLMLFVLSALLFVLERGRSHNASIERYDDYRVALARVAGGLARADTAEAFIECVWEGERAALRELKAFCREADKSTYLF